MSTDDRNLQIIIEDLTDRDLTESAFAIRWVEFICEKLPNLERDEILELIVDLENAATYSNFRSSHAQVLQRVFSDCFDEFGNLSEGPASFKVGYALAQTCALYPLQVEQRVFENIPDVNSARELFGFMALTLDPSFNSYIIYLQSKGIIDLQNWNTKERWPEQLSLMPGKVGNVPARASTKGSQFQISVDAQAHFPFLQDAIDENCTDPAFPTVWPIVSKLASQIARKGELSRHIALLGPPGVGKTESARILHHLLESMNAYGTGFRVFSPGKDTGQYVDQMAREMRNILLGMKQKGGLLLVDEAGKFHEGTSSNDPASFRKRTLDVVFEQTDELLKQGIVVVFAGYREEFEKVLAQDAGFERRVLMIDIEPPTSEQLAKSVWSSFASEGIRVPPNFEKHTKWLFDQMIGDSSMNFGYWATAKNFENALRDSSEGDFLVSGFSDTEEITADDFRNAAEDIGFKRSRTRELDFSGPITPGETPDLTFEAEVRSLLDPPSPPSPGRQIE